MASGALVPQGGSMPPPAPRPPKRKQEVLDEDEWVTRIEAIIERDFFPELSRLQSKVEWLEAIRSGNPQKIRQAQLNIAARRARSHTPGHPLFTPGGTAARLAPGTTPSLFPGATPAGGGGGGLAPIPERGPAAAAGGAGPSAGGEADGAAAAPASLDAFLAAHTSEDNASFGELLEDVNKRRRLRAAAAAVHQNPQLLLTAGPGAGAERTDGYGTGGQQPDTLVTWPHRPLNTLYYDGSTRGVVPYTERELSDMVQGPPKQILHRNTRFPKPEAAPGTLAGGDGAAAAAAGAAAASGAAAAGAGGGPRPTAADVGGTIGYDLLATPSFDPGEDGTPFMTWGDIEATPLRIEADDLPPGPLGQGGAVFRVAEMPPKERRGHALAAKAAVSLRRKAAVTGRGGLAAGTPALHGGGVRGATPGGGGGAGRPASGARAAAPLSDAARRLATSLQKGGQPDAQLRRSYAQTPGGGGGRGGPSGRAGTGAGGGSTWSAAPTPSRGWTPAGTPSVHATLQEEQLRVEAIMRHKEKEAQLKAELESARAAALSSFRSKQPEAPAGGGSGAAGGTGAGSLTDGLLKI